MPRIDANIIVRYLTADPPEHAERARELIAKVSTGAAELLLEEVILAEVVWTMSSFYRRGRGEIAGALTELLALAHLTAADKPALQDAVALFGRRNLDFADALLAAKALRSNDPVIYSFDHDFDGITGVVRKAP